MTPDRHTSEDALVRAHLHLANQAVGELARRLPSHVNRDDLSSAAMLGLAQAARSWDPDRGASFERHAATRIRGALLDELRDSDWASRSVRSRARRLQQAGEELTGRLGRVPTPAELATELGADPQAVHKLVGDVHRATVLNYESIVSQLQAEALILLRDGLNAHLDPDTLPAEPRPEGRLAKRRAAYHAAIAACSDFRARLEATPRPLLERAAEAGTPAPAPA